MGLFHTVGVMWSPALVGWGSKGGPKALELLGYYPRKLPTDPNKAGALSGAQRDRQTLNFWDVPGIYALYKGDTLVYVGQGVRIGDRLLTHFRDDHLVGRWDAFSWVSPVDIVERIDPKAARDVALGQFPATSPIAKTFEKWLDEIEALGIVIGKPVDNRQVPNFGDHTWDFVQVRSQHAQLTQAEMVQALYREFIELKDPSK